MKHLRELIKNIIEDNYALGNGAAVYPSSGGKFPYEVNGNFVAVPEDLEPKKNYVQDFNAFSSNKETFDFPQDEFFLGLKIEKDKSPKDPILSVAEKVISQLRGNIQFYSQLK